MKLPLYLFLLFYLLFFRTSLLVGQTPGTVPPPPSEDGMLITRERMPQLRSCDSLDGYGERNQCTTETILRMLREHLRWPAGSCAEGMVVVSFSVEADGILHDFRVTRGIVPAFDEEALRVVKLLAELTEPWHPATHGRERKPTRMLYHLPVKFKLE